MMTSITPATMRATGVLLILAVAANCRAAQTDAGRLCKENAASHPDVAIRACTAAIGSGQLSGADLASASLDRGIAYVAKENYDLAIRDFDQAIHSQPNLAAAFENRCRAYLRKHDDGRALPDCEQAIRLDPKAARAVYGRGVIRSHSRDYDRAMLDFEQAIRLDPNLAAAYSGRGFVRVKRGQYDQAIQDYGQALRLHPDGDAYYNRGLCYLRKGDYGRAMPDLDQAIRLAPNLAEAYSARGYVHLRWYEHDQAIRDYDQALRLRPSAKDYYNRGWAYARKGDSVSARRDFDLASRHRPATQGRWIWALLVPAVWLVYGVRRRRKANLVDIHRTEELARRSLDADTETPPAVSGEDHPDLVVAQTFAYPYDARLACALLESANIPTFLADEHTGATEGAWGGASDGLRLFVPASFLKEARALLYTRVSDEDLAAQAQASLQAQDPF